MRQLCFCPLFFHYSSLFSPLSLSLSPFLFYSFFSLFLSPVLPFRRPLSFRPIRVSLQAGTCWIYTYQRNGHGRADVRITDRQDAVLQGAQTFFHVATASTRWTRNQRFRSQIYPNAIFQLWSLTSATRSTRERERERWLLLLTVIIFRSDKLIWIVSSLVCRFLPSPPTFVVIVVHQRCPVSLVFFSRFFAVF